MHSWVGYITVNGRDCIFGQSLAAYWYTRSRTTWNIPAGDWLVYAGGATNQEIGHVLGISHETAKKHVTRIVEKLGARNRTHASIISNHAAISGDG